MDEALLVASVDLVAILVVEKRGHVFEGLAHTATEARVATPSTAARPRADEEPHVVGAYLCHALPGQDVAHVDRSHCCP